MFYDELVELLQSLLAPPGGAEAETGAETGAAGALTAASLLELFTGQQADMYTWYMRLLTAGRNLDLN